MKNIQKLAILVLGLFILLNCVSIKKQNSLSDLEETTVTIGNTTYDKETSLIFDKDMQMVITHCTGCHSAKLITQFHGTRTDWLEKIRWMQKTQKLWDLGEAEPVILTYLEKNYPPLEKNNRRANLKNIEWYNLK